MLGHVNKVKYTCKCLFTKIVMVKYSFYHLFIIKRKNNRTDWRNHGYFLEYHVTHHDFFDSLYWNSNLMFGHVNKVEYSRKYIFSRIKMVYEYHRFIMFTQRNNSMTSIWKHGYLIEHHVILHQFSSSFYWNSIIILVHINRVEFHCKYIFSKFTML